MDVVLIKNIIFSTLLISYCWQCSVIAGSSGTTFAEYKLERIINKEKAFFNYAQNNSIVNENELTRRAQEIVSAYERHIAENPKDISSLILFGKFLQKVGQTEQAIDFFLKADVLDPKLSVVKQQMASYLINDGKIVDAFPFLLMAAKLSPKEPTYHFELGVFIHHFLDELVETEILTVDSGQSLMLSSFREAVILSPSSFDYALRYAQAYFDCPTKNRNRALEAWDSILKKFPQRSDTEIDYIKLCKARILIELGKINDAKHLIQSIKSEKLKKAKISLLQQTELPGQINISPTQELETKTIQRKTGFLFPTDQHLQRMQSVSTRLREEKLLSSLRLDVLRAKLDQDGKIKVEVSQNINGQRPGR